MKLKKYSVLACGVLASAVLVACNGGAGTAVSQQTLTPMSTSNASVQAVTLAVSSKANLRSIAKGNGIYVAVGDSGAIFMSTDGNMWSSVNAGVSINITDIAYNNSNKLFYAIGDDGAVLSSPNGTSWTQYKTLNPAPDLYSIMAVNGHLVIGANDGMIFEIDTNVRDMVTVRNAPDSIKLLSAGYGNGVMLLGGNDGSILYKSIKGWNNNWNKVAKFSDMSINSLSYESANKWFLAGTSTGKVIQSESGIVWSSPVSVSSLSINSIIFDNKSRYFFVVGGSASSSMMMTSFDYDNWRQQTLPVSKVQLNDMKCFDNNDCFVVGESGTILSGLQRGGSMLPVWKSTM